MLAGNPDNRFLPFAVEEGGRIGTDAEAYIDAIVRAGSADPATWCATKTYCMRALAITTAKGIARVLTRRRLAPPSSPVIQRAEAALGDFPRAPCAHHHSPRPR